MSVEATTPKDKSISAAKIAEWHQGEIEEIKRERHRLEEMRQRAGIQGVDIERDLENSRFKLMGREEELRGLAAFLIAETSDSDSPIGDGGD